MVKIETPVWIPVLWRFVRVFIAGFIGTFSIEFFLRGDVDIRLNILQAAIVGGIAAVFKAIRDKYSDNSIVNKLPL